MDMDGILRRIQREGLRPLLAHPERYVYMGMNDYRRLHENGIDMQLNLMSLTGHYGPDARAKALRLLKEGFYSRVGTDLHRLRPFQHSIGVKCLTQKQIALIPKYSEQ
jgi:tyrosine-protein phosphatase YwqE